MTTFRGILPAAVTPFDAAGKFNPGAFEQLLARFYAAGAHGVYVCGSTGEGMLQSVAQRQAVTEAAVQHSPAGKQVLVHVGAYTTADAVALAQHSARAGAHAVSALPPTGSYSFAEIKAYYHAIATASDLPLLIYFMPALYPGISTAAQIHELCELPNVIGLKFTDFDLYKLSLIKQRGVTLFSGYDEVLVAGLLMGADGGIGSFYNVVPELFVELYTHAQAGEWAQARAVQDRINELITIGLRYPVVPAVKAILRRQGIDCGECLEPRRKLTAAEEADLDAQLGQSSFGGLLR
jgi:N-acetylneuraminate lyase